MGVTLVIPDKRRPHVGAAPDMDPPRDPGSRFCGQELGTIHLDSRLRGNDDCAVVAQTTSITVAAVASTRRAGAISKTQRGVPAAAQTVSWLMRSWSR